MPIRKPEGPGDSRALGFLLPHHSGGESRPWSHGLQLALRAVGAEDSADASVLAAATHGSLAIH